MLKNRRNYCISAYNEYEKRLIVCRIIVADYMDVTYIFSTRKNGLGRGFSFKSDDYDAIREYCSYSSFKLMSMGKG